MDRFFNSIGELFHVFPRMAGEKFDRLRRSFYFLAGYMYGLPFFHLIFNNYIASLILGLIICVLSIPPIFNVRRILNITGIGEALELLRITPTASPSPGKPDQGAAAVVINPLTTIFWAIALQIYFFILVESLAIPLLPLRNNPVFVFLFPTMAIAIAIAFKKTVLRVVNWISSVFILVLFLCHFLLLFPSLQARIGINLEFLPSNSLARLVNESVENQREGKRARIEEEFQEKILAWQKVHPGKDLPPDLEDFRESVRKGELRTLEEIKNGVRKYKDKRDFSQFSAVWLLNDLPAGKYELSTPVEISFGFDKLKPREPFNFEKTKEKGLIDKFEIKSSQTVALLGNKEVILYEVK